MSTVSWNDVVSISVVAQSLMSYCRFTRQADGNALAPAIGVSAVELSAAGWDVSVENFIFGRACRRPSPRVAEKANIEIRTRAICGVLSYRSVPAGLVFAERQPSS
jgi:hypothetical protein